MSVTEKLASERGTLGLAGLVALGITLMLSACAAPGATVGSGTIKTETRSVSGFSKVAMAGVGALTIRQTGVESLTISAEDNLLPLLTSTVSNGTLNLGVKSGHSVSPTKPIVYTLTVKNLDGVTLSGSGSVTAINITTPALDVELSGAGQMTISGSAPSQTVIISGAGNYMAKNFQTDSTQITLSGAGSAAVSARTTLNATLSGAGSLTYYGSPTVTQSVSGIGSIKQGQ